MKSFFQATLALFFCSCIIFIPFPYVVFPYTGNVTAFLFNDVLLFLAEHVFRPKGIIPEISSDSLLMYLLVLLLFVLACIIAFSMRFMSRQPMRLQTFYATGYLAGCYYLALHLMKYGVDKLLKAQFYLPEPNILYTTFGQLDQDILYWSTMGTSYPYNIFLGASEMIAAVLLLLRRTRVLGLLAAWALLLNIVAINFSFNISVKLFSLFLFFLCTWLLVPHLKALYRFFVLQQVTAGSGKVTSLSFLSHPFWKTALKTAAVLLVISEAAYPHLSRSGMNDDQLARPFLHGAYEVLDDPVIGKHPDIKRLFIHRRGYLIIENSNGRMKDYNLEIDRANQQFILTDHKHRKMNMGYVYHEADSILEVTLPGDSLYTVKAKALNWRALPALQSTFRWTIDAE